MHRSVRRPSPHGSGGPRPPGRPGARPCAARRASGSLAIRRGRLRRTMKPLLCTHRSSASPDRVWALASDFANAPGRIKAITKVELLTPGPAGAGTRFREWRGRQVVDMEVV